MENWERVRKIDKRIKSSGGLTCNAGKELASKTLDLAVGKGDKSISFQEIENALVKEIHDNADVVAIVETVSQMNAPVSVLLIVHFECGQHAKLDLRGVAVLLN